VNSAEEDTTKVKVRGTEAKSHAVIAEAMKVVTKVKVSMAEEVKINLTLEESQVDSLSSNNNPTEAIKGMAVVDQVDMTNSNNSVVGMEDRNLPVTTVIIERNSRVRAIKGMAVVGQVDMTNSNKSVVGMEDRNLPVTMVIIERNSRVRAIKVMVVAEEDSASMPARSMAMTRTANKDKVDKEDMEDRVGAVKDRAGTLGMGGKKDLNKEATKAPNTLKVETSRVPATVLSLLRDN
jgi:hypothetical protein